MEFLTDFPQVPGLLQSQPHLRGVLFDMDGTLFMTEPLHGQALMDMALFYGIRPPFEPTELEVRLKGMADHQVLATARNWPGFPQHLDDAGFIEEKNNRLKGLIANSDEKQWCPPGMVKFLKDAKAAGLLLGIVTSSERVVTQELLKKARLGKLFDTVITLQDVRHPKPHPWPYLQAMQQLGIGIRETVIFEDSHTGITAAKAAGARVIEARWW